MPFTPSHAVVALPFIRTPLVPAAIAVGAMTPDLPLFVRGTPLQYGRTHDLAWLPVTMLVALALLVAWRCILRPAARELAPGWLARRMPGDWDAGAIAAVRETFPPRLGGILLLLASLAIGVVSHIVWDLFTHEGRWGVETFPLLAEQWGPQAGYRWLQHGSSVIGLAIIGVWMIVWLSRRTADAVPHRVLPGAVRWIWWLSLPAILLFSWVIGVAAFGPFTAEWTVSHLAYRVLPPACAVWGALTIALCVVVQVLRSRRTITRRPA